MTTAVASPHVPRWTFADRLRKVRREARLSQAEFADRIGAQQKQLGQWEAGRNQPQHLLEVARVIEDEFGVPATWLLDLEVRHQGLEPRTRWFGVSAGQRGVVALPRAA